MRLSVFPLAIQVEDIKNFTLQGGNIVSFEKIVVQMPFFKIFSKTKQVDLNIHKPIIVLNESVFKSDQGLVDNQTPFEINRINITKGELTFRTSKLMVNLLEFDLRSFKKEENILFSLESPHLKVVFPHGGSQMTMEGGLRSEFKKQPRHIRLNNFYWSTPYLEINVNGRLFDDGTFTLHTNLVGSPEQLLYPILKDLNVNGYMYGNARVTRDKEGQVSILGNFKGDKFYSSGEEFGKLQGSARWNSRDKRIRINTSFNDGQLLSGLRLNSAAGTTVVEVRNSDAAKVCRILELTSAVPLQGVLKSGQLTIKNNVITGSCQVTPSTIYQGQDFNVGGNIHFTYHLKDRWARFSSRRINSEFGSLSLNGEWHHNGSRLDLDIGASVSEAAFLDKYSRFYLDLDLSRWKLAKGRGQSRLQLAKRGRQFTVESELKLRDFESSSQPIDSLQGTITSRGGRTTGHFTVSDPGLKGEAEIKIDDAGIAINFPSASGRAEKVLAILGLDLDLQGAFKGRFLYRLLTGRELPQIEGRFNAQAVTFYSFPLEDIQGTLKTDTDVVSLPDLLFNYMGGRGRTAILIDYAQKKYNLRGTVSRILAQRYLKGVEGNFDLTFSGQGDFWNDPIVVEAAFHDLSIYTDKVFSARASGEIFTDFDKFSLSIHGDVVNGKTTSPFTFLLNEQEGIFTGSYQLSMKDINILIPWGLNQGQLELSGEISSTDDGVFTTQGYANFNGRQLTFPNFPHTLDDYSGRINFQGLHFTLQSLRGTLGGGQVESSGQVSIQEGRLKNLMINLEGKKMTLYPMDRTTFTLSTRDLSLRYLNERLVLRGTLNFSSVSWEREIDEEISFNTDPALSPSESKILDLMEFDLRLVGRDNVLFSNSNVKATGQFNLQLRGTPDFPLLTGVIESREGELYFFDSTFNLLKGKISFQNKFMIDPIINIESEAFVKNYRIRFDIKGNSTRYKPEFKSSPPLPPQDILALISLGELFRGPTSTQLSSRIGTGTTGLFASEILTNQIKKSTKKIFGDYLLRLDPTTVGPSFQDTAKIIIGKSISKDFLIVYSTNFSNTPKEVWYIKYQISPSISLIGMKNEEGRLSLDISFRKRH